MRILINNFLIVSMVVTVACHNNTPLNQLSLHNKGAVAAISTFLTDSNFLALREMFHEPVDKKRKISFSTINFFLKENAIDSGFYNALHPVKLVENNYGHFFIIAADCVAGGDCVSYHVVAFQKGTRLVKDSLVGKDTGEMNESDIFSYRLLSDTSMMTSQAQYDNEKERPIDSTSLRVDFVPAFFKS